MNKNDLKTGMVATTRNEKEYLVYVNCLHSYSTETIAFVNINGERDWLSGGLYRDDLIACEFNDYDIVKLEIFNHPYAFNNIANYQTCRELVWERVEETPEQKEVKELEKQARDIANRLKELRPLM